MFLESGVKDVRVAAGEDIALIFESTNIHQDLVSLDVALMNILPQADTLYRTMSEIPTSPPLSMMK